MLVAAALATPGLSLAQDDREQSRSWSAFLPAERPVPVAEPRHVLVTFEDPSLGEWQRAGRSSLAGARQRAWVRNAAKLQQRRLDALAATGVQFQVRHRYVRTVNGVSLVVHGDGLEHLRSAAAVDRVVPVRTVWPMADGAGGGAIASAAAAAGDAGAPTSVRVGVLDGAVDSSHPALSGRVDAPIDATRPTTGPPARDAAPVQADDHATAVAGAVVRGAGADTDVRIAPIRVLTMRPMRDGSESLVGSSDDVLAGLEHAVDPDADGATDDALDVALLASGTPYASFDGSAEQRAVAGAAALGTLVVAAVGNDGSSGGGVGTVSSFAASPDALAVGAADLRDTTSAADVRVRGDGVDQTFERSTVVTSGAKLPSGSRPVVVVERDGDEVVDYLDAELRSRVTGAIALVAAHDGALVADQVRAAGDAGAIAVLLAHDGAGGAAGTVDARSVGVAAVAISRTDARALRDAISGGAELSATLDSSTQDNPAFGTRAAFSSSGPTLGGAARPDVLGPGVGMELPAAGGGGQVLTGTSVAAAWVAGQAASLVAQRPELAPDAVAAVLVGSAVPLGTNEARPAVHAQGGGVVHQERASRGAWLVNGSGRIELGAVRPGERRQVALALRATDGRVPIEAPRMLHDDGGHDAGIVPALADGQVVFSIPADAGSGPVGGWIVLPDLDVRIPWSATVRTEEEALPSVQLEVSSDRIRPMVGPGAFAGSVTLAVGGRDGGSDELGLAAAQRVEVRLVDARGRDHGRLGAIDEALPGVYTFGIAGVGTSGALLKPGTWTLQVRSRSATQPTGPWTAGPSRDVTVLAPLRAVDAPQ